MSSVQDKIKECTDEVLNKLKAYDFRRKNSPDPMPPMPKVKRAKWKKIVYEPKTSAFNCDQCGSYRRIIEHYQTEIYSFKEQLASSQHEISSLRDSLARSEEIRKYLNQILQDKKGPIRVCCRVKPASGSCIAYPGKRANEKSELIQISRNTTKNFFLFDKVFDEGSSQAEVFSEVESYIQAAVDGGKVCIFSYGQTGSGKTFTLEGQTAEFRVTEQSGILPRSASLIFSEILRQGLQAAQVSISCAEVYMDQISDLLSETRASIKSIDSVHWQQVPSLPALLAIICESSKKRTTRDTHLNLTSSRSHTIYQICIRGQLGGKDKAGKLCIIDLAGSERPNSEPYSNKSSEEVETMKKVMDEGKFINRSLSCLKRVFMALAARNGTLVPFRDSKLTKILQEQIQAGVCIVFVTVSPDNYQESLESLKFGSNIQEAKV